MKITVYILGLIILCINQYLSLNTKTFANEMDFKNIYGVTESGDIAENVKYAKQMGYDCIVINPFSKPKEYRNNPNCANLKYYLLDPQWYPQILSNFSRYIDITESITDEAKKFYNRYMVWKSNEAFPYNLATGNHLSGTATKFAVLWDFQQQAVIDFVVEKIIRLAKSYEFSSQPFTFAGYIIDEPKLAGNFFRLDKNGNNIPTTLSHWTGMDSGLIHNSITHEYATYSEGTAAFYKKLRERMKEAFDHPKWIIQSTLLYNEVDNSEWIYQIKDRTDKNELTPDMLFQKSPLNTDYVDDINIFNSGIVITKNMVGISQSSENDLYKNLLFTAKSGINGAWYNWFGCINNADTKQNFDSILDIYPRLKLIKCLPNWDNLNNVSLNDRSWDGDVYQSTTSYASSNVVYSRHPETAKIFAVFLSKDGVIKLNAGEKVTSIRCVDDYFAESDDSSKDVDIIGNEINLKSPDNINKGYVFTVSSKNGQTAETDKGTVNTISDSGCSNGITKTKWSETMQGKDLSDGSESLQRKDKNDKNTKSSETKITTQQAAATQNEWQQVLIRTAAQKTAGLSGGSGGQMIFGITYAPSNSNIVFFVTDTSQVWKSTDGGNAWRMKHKGFGPNGGASVAVDPNNENNILVAGNTMSSATAPSDAAKGIYRTTNGGDNWSLVKSVSFVRPDSDKTGVLFAYAGNTIYVGTYKDGLMKSTDGGDTWTGVLKSGGGTVLSGTYIYDVKVHPTDTTILYLATAAGLHKIVDTNSAATVTKIGTGLPVNPGMVVIDTANPLIMYATAGTYGVYISTDGGLNFSARNNGLSAALGSVANNLVISPADPKYLYVTFLKWGNHIYHTSDGGANWYQAKTMDESNNDGWVNGSQFGYTTALGVSTGRAPIAVHPTDKNIAISVGTGEIIKKTTNGGVDWKYSCTGYTGQRVGSFGDYSGVAPIAWDKNNSKRFILFTTDWRPYLTEDGGDIFRPLNVLQDGARTSTAGAIDPTPDSKVIVTAVGTYSQQRVQVSRDGGNTWTIMTNTTDKYYQFIAFHPQKTKIIYAGKFKSSDSGYTWTSLTKKVGAMYPGNGDIVYTVESVSGGNRIYKSTDGGVTWVDNKYPLLGSGYVGEMKVDPDNQDKLYVAVRGKGIYIVNGSSMTLKDTANGLELNQFGMLDNMFIARDTNNSNVLYTAGWYQSHGHSNGIYRSVDGGENWEDISLNLEKPFTVWSISVNPQDSYVYIGSSHGTWKLPPPGSSTADTTPPTVTITSPTSADMYSTALATIDISGTASDDSSVSNISWSNDRGGNGTATGTTNWSISGINLFQGDNLITVTATDKSNNCGTDTVTVSYTGTATTNSVTADKLTSKVTLDGNLNESSWNIAHSVNKLVSGSPNNTAQFGVLWDDVNLYVGIQVQDSNLYSDSSFVYDDDSVELYIDADHNRSTTYDANDRQYIKVYNNTTIWEKNNNINGVLHSSTAITDGYSVELAIPWTNIGITPAEGVTIGIDVGYNDDDNGSTRDGQAVWAGNAKNYTNTSAFGDLILGPTPPDKAPPSCSISINNGNVYSSSAAVSLTLSATDDVGVTGYYLSSNSTTPSVSDSGWVAVTPATNYNGTVDYTLDSTDGEKTVSVWCKDAAGNISNAASDSILLDTTSPTVTITSPTSSATYTTTSNSISIGGSVSDSSSGVSAVTWSSDRGGNGSASGTTDWAISGISLLSGDNIITVTATDKANNSKTTAITVTYDATPIATTSSAGDITSNSATLNGIVNANGLSTTVWFEYSSSSGTYNSKTTTQTVNGSTDTTVSASLGTLSPSTAYYYRVAAKNNAGIKYGAEEIFTTLDTESPVGSIILGNGAVYTRSATVDVNLSATDDVGVTGYFLTQDSTVPTSSSAGWMLVISTVSYSTGISYKFTGGDGDNTLYVWYKDAAGNISNASSDSITLDTVSPVVSITSPTSNTTYNTTSSTIDLSGTAFDGVSGINSVTWSNDKGGSGTANGTVNWSITGAGLSVGDNIITITAVDNAGNSGTSTITVNYSVPAPKKTVNVPNVRSGITVDGSLTESVWNIVTDVNKSVIGSVNNTIKFALAWDNTYLYVAAEVLDSNLYNDSTKSYEDDSIEIYIDGDHNKGTTYDSSDRQYIKGWNDSSLWEKNGYTSGVLHAGADISGGYTVELAIPWSNLGVTPGENMFIGFDIGCNDDDDGSGRDSQAMWSGTSNNYQSTTGFGEIILDAAAPDISAPNCSVSINNGNNYTNSTTVTLNLSATDDVGVVGYYLSQSATIPAVSDSGWISVTSTTGYNASVTYTLSSGDGEKIVYVWYKDAAGNVSSIVSDSIMLDTTTPVVTITSPTSSANYTTTSSTIDLSGSATDGTSGVKNVTWSNDRGESGTVSGTASWSVSGLSLVNGNNVVTITATDNAGNAGTAVITVTVSTTTTVNGLQAYYTLNEGSGALAGDSSGNNNSGTISGATWTTGKKGGGLSFDGINDYVRTPGSSSLAISENAITISAWVNYLNTNTHQIFIAKPYKEGSHVSPYFSYSMHGLFVNSTQIRPRFWLAIGGTAKSVSSSELLNSQTWYHLTGVYNGSTMKIYINGVERGSVSVSGNITSYTTPLLIGANGGFTECYKGSIDDVRIYNRALSNQEVQDLYTGK